MNLQSSLINQAAVNQADPVRACTRKKIWIDLDNSPHVPFFKPIIEELETRGYSVLLTARDCFQVCELAELFNLICKPVGRHHGKHKILKLAGLCLRASQMAPTILREKPDLALSHGSRGQLLLSAVLRIPSITIFDYEFTKAWALIHPSWVLVPEMIPDHAIRLDKRFIRRYPGIKEDVYIPRFKPDPTLKARLGLSEDQLLVTVRPPATEAHYHNPESDRLFAAVIDFLGVTKDVLAVVLPRNEKQAASIRKTWMNLCTNQKIIILNQVVDGLNLIWHSDLVISGGGTMNREASALGVPVYSIFRGKIGAVDRYLAESGRLVLLETIDDIRTKLVLARRHRPYNRPCSNGSALQTIVQDIVAIVEA